MGRISTGPQFSLVRAGNKIGGYIPHCGISERSIALIDAAHAVAVAKTIAKGVVPGSAAVQSAVSIPVSCPAAPVGANG